MKNLPPFNRRKIISVDPGGTTGLAYMEAGKVIARSQIGPDLSNTPQHREWCGATLRDLFNDFDPDYIVYEEFEYRPHQDHAELVSKEHIGVIKLWCEDNDKPYVDQKPAVGKVTGRRVFWTERKLKQVGLWLPNRPHAMDATGHLLYHVSFTLKEKYYLMLLKNLGDVA